MKKLFLGAVSGLASLGLAVPMIATAVSAQTITPTTATAAPTVAYTQACIDALKAADTARIARMEAMAPLMKAQATAKRDALQTVLSIADPSLRREAMKAAKTNAHAAVQTQMDAIHTAQKTVKDAVKTACATDPAFTADHSGRTGLGMGGFKMKGGHGPRGMKPAAVSTPAH